MSPLLIATCEPPRPAETALTGTPTIVKELFPTPWEKTENGAKKRMINILFIQLSKLVVIAYVRMTFLFSIPKNYTQDSGIKKLEAWNAETAITKSSSS